MNRKSKNNWSKLSYEEMLLHSVQKIIVLLLLGNETWKDIKIIDAINSRQNVLIKKDPLYR